MDKDFALEDFKAHDEDGDGAITYDEYLREQIAIRDYDSIAMVGITVSTMDKDKSGAVNLEEFLAMFYPTLSG